MTRDEAVRYFKRHIDLYCVEGICREAEEMAIEALNHNETVTEFADRCRECGAKYGKLLKQQPCEDCISRQAAIDAIWDGINMDIYTREVKECLEALPPVTPQLKTGHWIETAEEYYKAINEKGGGVNENTPYFTDDIACSECLTKFSVIDNETERFEYCPHCGAKMVEPQEGSEG